MTDPIMSYASVMRAQIDRLDVVAQNASNTNSPGYLQQSAVNSSDNFLSLIQPGTQKPAQTILHSRDLGSLKVTNRDTDFGMASDGWFVLEGAENLVTRNGRFSISQNGDLQLDGYRLMGESGPITNLSGNILVHSDGTIYSNGQLVDKLKIVSITKDQSLESFGNGIYSVSGVGQVLDQPKIIQGALTGSNVSLEADMTKMIEITRHVEMLQRAMSAYNDMLEVGINQLGK